jgi:hypothetical protein
MLKLGGDGGACNFDKSAWIPAEGGAEPGNDVLAVCVQCWRCGSTIPQLPSPPPPNRFRGKRGRYNVVFFEKLAFNAPFQLF